MHLSLALHSVFKQSNREGFQVFSCGNFGLEELTWTEIR